MYNNKWNMNCCPSSSELSKKVSIYINSNDSLIIDNSYTTCTQCQLDSECSCSAQMGRTEEYVYIGGGLAPRSDGKCYCGEHRMNCYNFRAYGVDCCGFSN